MPKVIYENNECGHCKNMIANLKCLAFPNGIPSEILNGGVSHKHHYNGDNNYLYRPDNLKPTKKEQK